MAEKPVRLIAISVASAVLAAGLIWLCGEYLLGAVKAVGRGIVWIWHWVTTTHPVPGWTIILGALLVVGPSILLTRANRFIRSRFPSEPDWRGFTEMKFLGVIWRWEYFADGSIGEACPFCPKPGCDMQMTMMVSYLPGAPTRLLCDLCGHEKGVQYDDDRLQSIVRREIHRRLRNDQWKTEIKEA